MTFGEALCFLGIENSPVYIYASRDTAVLWLCDTALHGNYKSDNADAGDTELLLALRESFTDLLCLRTLSMNSRIQTLTKLSIREKLLFFLSQTCREAQSSDTSSVGTCDKSILGHPFEISMSRDDLAAYIGANRAAVSRELSRMKKDRLIDYAGNSFRLFGHD